MSLTENGGTNGFYMPVAPAYAGGYGNSGFGGLGGDWGWIILLLLFAGGWGNGNGFGGGYGNGAGSLYPWMNQAEVTTGGFQNAALGNQLTAIQGDLGDIQSQLCNGFAGVNATVNSTAANAEVAANARQMANMQQMFGLSTQFANCCCENRLGIANLSADIAREACADRAAVSDGIRDILASNSANTQRILDQLCQDKIDAKNDEISQLRQEVLYARGQASQVAQNATIIDGIYNRLNQCPVGTVPVYGEQPIFTCHGNTNTCGCGCGSF